MSPLMGLQSPGEPRGGNTYNIGERSFKKAFEGLGLPLWDLKIPHTIQEARKGWKG